MWRETGMSNCAREKKWIKEGKNERERRKEYVGGLKRREMESKG